MISIACDSLSLSFGEKDIFKNITFSLNEGDRLGIVGVNGAGKSSLLSSICGEIVPSAGNVIIARDKKIGLLHQNAVSESERSIMDEALSSFGDLIKIEAELEDLRKKAEESDEYAGKYSTLHERFTESGGYEFRGRARGILKSLGIGETLWNERVSTLSGGQKTRLALACLLLRDPDILMLDEPTNHLDASSMFWLENYLSKSRKTLLIVSHDRFFLDVISTDILEIENGKGKIYHGNYSAYVGQKKVDREIQQRHYDNQQKEIKRQEAYIEQQRRWNRERNIVAAESRQKLLDKMERVERPDLIPDNARMSFGVSGESGNDVLSICRLSKSFSEKDLFDNLSLEIKKNDRCVITGNNGCGKSTLLKIIAGRLQSDTGYVLRGANVTVGYYDQENRELNGDGTVIDQLWNRYPTKTETEIRNALALFLFRGDDVFKKVSVLSGGEKARLSLACLMLSKVNLLILDEPTNHLDIGTAEALEEAIIDFPGTVIAVSHDRYFIRKISTRIIHFAPSDGSRPLYIPRELEYGFDDYVGICTEVREDNRKDTSVSEQKERYIASKQNRSEQKKKEAFIRRTRSEAEKTEKRIAELNDELNGEAAFDHIRYSEISDEIGKLEEKLLELYEILEEEETF